MSVNKDYMMNEIADIAWAVDTEVPAPYHGVCVSRAAGSLYGEKTEKGIIEKTNRNVLVNNKLDYRVIDICDFIRATLVADEYEHIPALIDIMKREFPDLKGRLVDNVQRGYKCVHLKTAILDGVCADIHIVTPQQGQLNEIHHVIYEKIRALPHGSPERQNLEEIGKRIYGLLWGKEDMSNDDARIQSKIEGYGLGLKNDLVRWPKDLVYNLSLPPYTVQDDELHTNGVLAGQAKMAHDFSVDKQQKLVKICEGLFDTYKEKVREI